MCSSPSGKEISIAEKTEVLEIKELTQYTVSFGKEKMSLDSTIVKVEKATDKYSNVVVKKTKDYEIPFLWRVSAKEHKYTIYLEKDVFTILSNLNKDSTIYTKK